MRGEWAQLLMIRLALVRYRTKQEVVVPSRRLWSDSDICYPPAAPARSSVGVIRTASCDIRDGSKLMQQCNAELSDIAAMVRWTAGFIVGTWTRAARTAKPGTTAGTLETESRRFGTFFRSHISLEALRLPVDRERGH